VLVVVQGVGANVILRLRAHPALIGAVRTTSLIAVLPEGGSEAIASRGKSPDHDELLDHAAMEFGTD
jgi:argininosuccinate synthase